MALLVDGVDGTLARKVGVEEKAPNLDGIILDSIIDSNMDSVTDSIIDSIIDYTIDSIIDSTIFSFLTVWFFVKIAFISLII